MGEVKDRLIACATREWRYFGESTRSIDNVWTIVGDEATEPFTSHISHYWASVGHPAWNGATDQPWSAAFICWCFKIAHARFSSDATHSVYIDRIRRHDEMSEALSLHPPETLLEPGDLIWNSRQLDPADPDPTIPVTHQDAIEALDDGDFFISHVDIVVSVDGDRCESIGGNVSNLDVGGSVTRSTWRLNNGGILADPRKHWIGVVKNAL